MIPKAEYNPALSIQDNLAAICSWLNFALREITAGRVPAIKDDTTRQIEGARAALEDALCEQDEEALAWRAEIENALCELDGEV